jgi:hypothetical protein
VVLKRVSKFSSYVLLPRKESVYETGKDADLTVRSATLPISREKSFDAQTLTWLNIDSCYTKNCSVSKTWF